MSKDRGTGEVWEREVWEREGHAMLTFRCQHPIILRASATDAASDSPPCMNMPPFTCPHAVMVWLMPT
eukprot:354531-Chlamydomonas_euryale.AAC.3